MRRPKDTISREMTEQAWRLVELQRHRVRQLGDRIRELNDWKTGYEMRTGRAA